MRGTLLGDLCDPVRDDDPLALGGGRGLSDPELVLVPGHLGLQVGELVREQKGLRDEGEVLLAMDLAHLGDLLVHEVFPCDVVRVGEVVDFLVTLKRLIDRTLHSRARPHYGPLIFSGIGLLSEAVVLEGVSDDLDIAFVELEVVAAVRGDKGTDGNGVFVGTKN